MSNQRNHGNAVLHPKIRTHWGFVAFDFVGKQVSKFLSFSSNGAQFVFGSELIAQEKSFPK